MAKKDPRIDAYIAKSADFAKPILNHVRDIVHAACPEVVESLKWSTPAFDFHGPLILVAAFKAHCRVIFWKRKLIFGKDAPQFGMIKSMADLPPKKDLLKFVKEGARINAEGIKPPSKPKPKARAELVVPDYFLAALKKNAAARKTFENFSYSHKKEYVTWITEAKREETRARRMATALEWLAEGKPHNWKYANC